MWKSLSESRPTSRDELGLWYEAILTEQENRGLSVAEAADEVGVSSATLYSWRRRLSSGQSKARLLEVSVTPEAVSSDAMALTVDDRFRLEVRPGFDEDVLARLVSVLARC